VGTDKASLVRGDKRRREIIKFVRAHWAKRGYAPSFQEIAEAVGLSSTNGAREHVLVLLQEGRLTQDPGKYRSLRAVADEDIEKTKRKNARMLQKARDQRLARKAVREHQAAQEQVSA
jgi:repressor LexA